MSTQSTTLPQSSTSSDRFKYAYILFSYPDYYYDFQGDVNEEKGGEYCDISYPYKFYDTVEELAEHCFKGYTKVDDVDILHILCLNPEEQKNWPQSAEKLEQDFQSLHNSSYASCIYEFKDLYEEHISQYENAIKCYICNYYPRFIFCADDETYKQLKKLKDTITTALTKSLKQQIEELQSAL